MKRNSKFVFLFILTPAIFFLAISKASLGQEQLPEKPVEEKLSSPQPETPSNNKSRTAPANYTIFDDKMLLNGYAQKYRELPKEILLEMIKDETLSSFKSAAAVRVFNEKFSQEVVSREKKKVEKILLRRLNRTNSPFIQVEIMYTLCRMDRYRYFKSMVPALIQKLDHYNSTINEMAFESLDDIIKTGSNRAREARIVFNTLRNVLFLSRKRLANIKVPDQKLAKKLKLVRWSTKVLGSQELKRLPKEVINLL